MIALWRARGVKARHGFLNKPVWAKIAINTLAIAAITGFLCGLFAVVASARLGFHSNDVGVLDELRVIAAAVIGGTALSVGIGTI